MASEYVDYVSPNEVLKLVEHEMTKFGNWNNLRSTMAKYMIGSIPPQEQLIKVAAILTAEIRQHVHREITEKLPEDPIEATAVVRKKARRLKTDWEESLMNKVVTLDDKELEVTITGETREGKAIKSLKRVENKKE